METPTLAAAPVPAAMVMAEATTTAPIRPEATAATTMADAMVAVDFMRLRSADRMARLTQRAFIVVVGESHATLAWRRLSDFGDRRLITYRSRGPAVDDGARPRPTAVGPSHQSLSWRLSAPALSCL